MSTEKHAVNFNWYKAKKTLRILNFAYKLSFYDTVNLTVSVLKQLDKELDTDLYRILPMWLGASKSV